MRIQEIIWLDAVVDKLAFKHGVSMSESKLPKFQKVAELVTFFDDHDMGVFWDELPEKHFKVELKKRRFLIAVNGNLMNRLSTAAKAKHTSTNRLVNVWLKEKLAAA
ncbi:MAG: hypothetical protein C5B50_13200 [Verrucomicrobia bacterium]|nr:MAG: hypothetical protein C5B50_13200 [Verrucomicrobiota bacterium]